MAIIANTFETYGAVGVREDLADVIYNISPEETPFLSNSGRGTANQTFTEWQTDSLANANNGNAVVEGDDISAFDAVVPTVRLGNYCQISRKTVILSDTEEQVVKAGRKSELAYQIAKKSAELKRDMEAQLLSNQAAVAGGAAVARVTGSMGAFLKTNVEFGAGGANPVYTNIPNATRTDGTLRNFVEASLKNVAQLAWVTGGNPKTLMVGAVAKQEVSGFSGIATKTYYQNDKVTSAIIGAADVYVSDFGTLSIVPNRFQRSRDAWLLDWEYVQVAYLRKFRQVPLAKTGDAEKRMLIVEYALKVLNEGAHGLIADIQ